MVLAQNIDRINKARNERLTDETNTEAVKGL